ncbi:hypothetical protein GSI_04889 [Ganoderma sinense ZZ0214-1]|uniref:Uncharacterized protein n=1 Tax=Ganoderma sinense ZZ0214-1 TaxID=1077348 RepID=A0A2G8SG93_9APHY|nr:hypothetical protein GSI_04889 [Ganoderma sinense ZZ0214-1]
MTSVAVTAGTLGCKASLHSSSSAVSVFGTAEGMAEMHCIMASALGSCRKKRLRLHRRGGRVAARKHRGRRCRRGGRMYRRDSSEGGKLERRKGETMSSCGSDIWLPSGRRTKQEELGGRNSNGRQ